VEASNRDTIVHVFSGRSGDEAVKYDILKDVDTTVAQYCSKMKLPFPQELEERILYHIRAVEAWADHYKGGDDEKAEGRFEKAGDC